MKTNRIDNKKRRIRKKLFLGEFAVLGFELRCQTKLHNYDTGEWDAFVDDFIDYIESIGLCFGGGGLELFDGFIIPLARYGSVTVDQRNRLGEWLLARDEIIDVNVGELVDANYGDF